MARKNKNEFDFEDELALQREEEAEEKSKRRIPFILPLLGCGLPLLLIGGLLLAPFVPTAWQRVAGGSGVTHERIVNISSVLIEGDGAVTSSGLDVTVNGMNVSGITSNADGAFRFPVDLKPGENIIVVSNPGGDTILTEIINYVTVGPQINITYPTDGQILTTLNVTVTGTTDPGATVTVNGTVPAAPAPVGPDGQWTAPVVLVEGTNTITAVAENENGTTQDHVMVYVDSDNDPTTPAGDPPPVPGGGSGSTPPGGGSGSTPPGGGGGSTPPGGGSGSTPPGGGSGSTPPGGGSGSTPPGGGGVTIFPSKVIISKILYNGDTPDGAYSEYVEIRNTGTGPEDISNWQVFDSNGNVFFFGNYTMSSGEVIRIGTNQGALQFASPGSVWNSMGEPGYLRNAAGNLVDIYSY